MSYTKAENYDLPESECRAYRNIGECYYDGVSPSNWPASCKECSFSIKPGKATNRDKFREVFGHVEAYTVEYNGKLGGWIENDWWDRMFRGPW